MENSDTAKGRQEHDRVHTQRVERRGNQVKLYEYSVFSESLGMAGKCDCVEATADEHGCMLPGIPFAVKLYPVEFKHGNVRQEREYELQLCAQAMCLEEMYHTEIPEGSIFYISSHRRKNVVLDDELRSEVRDTVQQLDALRKNMRVPMAEYGPKCKRCSIRELCMPNCRASAQSYCKDLEQQAKEVESL
jgi:CRISPR-associated exonuclease Cas4